MGVGARQRPRRMRLHGRRGHDPPTPEIARRHANMLFVLYVPHVVFNAEEYNWECSRDRKHGTRNTYMHTIQLPGGGGGAVRTRQAYTDGAPKKAPQVVQPTKYRYSVQQHPSL